MKKIMILTDYKGNFGSKYNAKPYNSGLDKSLLREFFAKKGLEIDFFPYYKVFNERTDFKNNIVLHDSIEDTNYYYKSYMEDIIYALELHGAHVIPGFKYIKAHNNKVFMEMLRFSTGNHLICNLESKHYGCYEEFCSDRYDPLYPAVIKGAQDAQGRQVRLGVSRKKLEKAIKHLSRTRSTYRELWEFGRQIKYKGYTKESKYRGKFILQTFIPNLPNDWKILIFNDKYYILNRGVPEGDFRASGSKFDYKFGSKADPPAGVFDYAKSVFKTFNVPYISLDIGYDGNSFFLIEFQFVSFGSSTQLKSDCFFCQDDTDDWHPKYNKYELEELYCDAIVAYLLRNSLISK